MVDIFLLSELQEAEQDEGILLRGGGSAANTASWLACNRTPSTFVGCAGADVAGAMLVHELEAFGVVRCVRTVPNSETGSVLIRVEDDGTERVMRSSRGANTALTPDDIANADLSGLTCLHITGYSLLSPHGLDLLEAASRIARARRALLSFDPSSAGVIHQVGAPTLLAAISRCGVDILLPNAMEAAAMVEEETVTRAAQVLAGWVPTVLVKVGAAGAVFAAAAGTGNLPTTRLQPVDPTGAGDAFDAGAIAALVAGKPAAEACHEGMTLAAEVLSHYGGRPQEHAGDSSGLQGS